jgi:hypothetical protein
MVPLEGVENVCKLDLGGGCRCLWMLSQPMNCTIWVDEFYVMWTISQ